MGKETMRQELMNTPMKDLLLEAKSYHVVGRHEMRKCELVEAIISKMEEKLGLNLANYTDESLEKAQHPFEIEKADDVIIHLDYRQSGLGSNSCGEEQLEENKVKLQDFAMAFTVQAAECGTEIREARKQYID